MSLRAPTAEYYILLALLILPQTDQVQFSTKYQGSTVRRTVGSSVQFNWSFTGDVSFVRWGLTLKADSTAFDNNQVLYSLTKSGLAPVIPPAAYTGRVSGSRSGGQATFTLSNLETSDTRFYGCLLYPTSPDDFSRWDNVYLVVEGPPVITRISKNQTVNEGSSVTLNCSADGNPAPTSITWTRLSDNSVVSFPLTVRKQDEGGYRCTANNGVGSPASSDVFITVHYGATITSATSTVTQSWIGKTVILTCVADGVPTPVLTWKKPDGSELKKVTAMENIANAEMKGDNDFGSYTCHAENGVGAAATRKVEVKQIKAPGSPIITLDVQATSLSATWTEPDNGGSPITGYRLVLLQGDSVIKNESVTNKILSWSKGELMKNTSYTLKVSAKNYAFEGNASEKEFTTKYEAPGVNVQCNSENMTITIPKSLLRGMDREHLRLLDTTCKATETSSHFSLTTPLTGCNTTSRHTPTAIVYSNAVLEIPVAAEDVVTRVREIEIQFSCFYSKYGVVSSVGWKPSDRKLVFSDEGHGNFTFSLNMFPDKRFVSPYMKDDFPVAVVLRKLLFFEVSVTSDDKQLSIRADRCYATPTQDLTSALKYEFLKKGCPNDVTVKYLSAPSVNVQRFSLEAFKFIADHPFVFVHCHVIVCNATDPGSKCAKSCSSSGRGRRKVAAHTNEVYSLVQGPLYLARKKRGEKHEIGQDKSGSSPTITMALFVICVVCLAGTALMAIKKSRDRPDRYIEAANDDLE